jgi:uncharacterized membrane protein
MRKDIAKKQDKDLSKKEIKKEEKQKKIEPVVKKLEKIVAGFFEGPLPPPNLLKQYNEIDPTFANRIVQMAERAQAHRHDMDKRSIEGQFKERRIGQIFGLIIGIVAILGGVVAAIYGAEWPGGFIGTGGVAALVAVIVYGKKSREKSK